MTNVFTQLELNQTHRIFSEHKTYINICEEKKIECLCRKVEWFAKITIANKIC